MATRTIKKKPVSEEKMGVDGVVAQTKTTPRRFDKEDLISCRSITVGKLYLDGIKSGNPYMWADYGDTEDVEYQDLATMVRSKNNGYIYGPLFVIEDDDFIKEFPVLEKFYNDQYSVKELEGILDLSVRDMIATIKDLPKGAKESLKNIASTKIVNGELDSVKKIRALDDLFGTELNLLSSIFSDEQ